MPTEQVGHSRRSVLRGAAGIGAAGIAATALTGVAGPALAAAKPESGREAGPDAGHEGGSHPVVAHVRDASTGHIELYSGTSQVHLRDKDLAERILRASQKQVR
ncbi:MAG TPA: hypothetical protein VFI65_30195 [Streptosporangiaceae bacterium]|nr:hypothetical protein [Streptosporangiaceae bacterium]